MRNIILSRVLKPLYRVFLPIFQAAWVSLLLSLIPTASQAQTESTKFRSPSLFDELGTSLTEAFTGTNLYLHLAGVASTPLLIHSGVDGHVYESFRHSPNSAAWPGAVVGSGAAAALTAGGLYWSGSANDNAVDIGGAIVVIQTTVVTAAYIKTLKAMTGRAHPTNTSGLSAHAQSREFELGSFHLLNGYGWPSGHVSHTVAVTAALSHYYPEVSWLPWLGAGLSTYMLYTVSAFDTAQMHWFSDGVAGAFMGYAIGSSIGKVLHQSVSQTQLTSVSESLDAKVKFTPLPLPDGLGLMGQIRF